MDGKLAAAVRALLVLTVLGFLGEDRVNVPELNLALSDAG